MHGIEHSNSTIEHNQAIGGQLAGGNGADGVGGGIANTLGSTLTVSSCIVSYNQAVGGAGGAGGKGGDGLGGGIYNDSNSAEGVSSLTVTRSTITHSKAQGGAGRSGHDGQGVGGGAYFASGGSVCLDAFTQAHVKKNHAPTSDDDVFDPFA